MLASVQASASRRLAYRGVAGVVDFTMGQFVNWMTLVGVALIVAGLGLLVCAIFVARALTPAQHRRCETTPDRMSRPDRLDRREHRDRRPAPRGGFTRGVAPPMIRQPDIRRSALLADTMPLRQVPRANPMPGNVMPGNVMPGNVMPGNVMPGNVMPDGVMPSGVMPAGVVPPGARPPGGPYR